MVEDFLNFIPQSGKALETCEPWSVVAESAGSQKTKFMGPTWGPSGSCRPQMGPMLTPWTLLSGVSYQVTICPLSYAHGFAVHCSVMVIFWVTGGFLWSAYSYPLGSLHWHWGNCQGYLGASEVILKIWNWPLTPLTSPNDDVMKWKCSLHYWPFLWGIIQSLVDFSHKGPVICILWCLFSLMLV